MKIRIDRHLMVGGTSCGFNVYVDPDTIPDDRRSKISGGTHMSGEPWNKLWQPLVEVMLPDGHHDLSPSPERYDQFMLWEKRAKVVERSLVYKAFADTPDVEDPTFLWVEYDVRLPFKPLTTVDLEFGPYQKSILLFQEPGGKYQCFLPDSVWLAQFRDCQDEIPRQYCHAQQVQLELVWACTFLDHVYAGVQVS